MSTYYILEKFTSDTEGLTVKSPYTYFSDSVIECNDLGDEPFKFDTLEEAKDFVAHEEYDTYKIYKTTVVEETA